MLGNAILLFHFLPGKKEGGKRRREAELKRRRDEKDGAKPQVHSGNTNQNPLIQSTLETEMIWNFLQISLLPGKGLLVIKATGDSYLNESFILENMPSYRRPLSLEKE